MRISARAAGVVAALLFPATLLVGVQSGVSTASADNPDGCRGQIMDFYKASGTIHVRSRIWCSITQDRIVVTPFLRQGDRERTPTRECFNTYVCEQTASMPDVAGTQAYSLRFGFAIAGANGNTFVHRNVDRFCDWDFPCAAATKNF